MSRKPAKRAAGVIVEVARAPTFRDELLAVLRSIRDEQRATRKELELMRRELQAASLARPKLMGNGKPARLPKRLKISDQDLEEARAIAARLGLHPRSKNERDHE